MSGMLKGTLLGRMGGDPELRYTAGDQPKSVCSFSVAFNDPFDKNENGEPVTQWVRVTAWGRQAEVISQHFQKGSEILLEGRIKMKEFTDKEGNTRSNIELTATDVYFTGGSRVGEKVEIPNSASNNQNNQNSRVQQTQRPNTQPKQQAASASSTNQARTSTSPQTVNRLNNKSNPQAPSRQQPAYDDQVSEDDIPF